VALIKVDTITFEGTFRPGETEQTLRKFVALPPGGVVTAALADQLRAVGYRARFEATGDGEVRVVVEPGRLIRRVRVRGYIPLPQRDVRRVLSPRGRPGALSPGQCVPPARLRKAPPPSACAPGALACRRWEQGEIERYERYLFDQGYLRGTARLGFACGRDGEADLYVFLDKGKPFRAKKIRVIGNLTTRDHDWIRRTFRPTIALLPIPKRITRKHIEQARERVLTEYAQPRSGATAGRRQLQLPYPGIRVDTNFDELTRDNLPPDSRTFVLEVDVQLGNGVRTAFLGNDRITDNRLRSNLQLFERREPATAMAAIREAENLRNYYQSRGFLLAEVDGRFQDFGALKQLTFVIHEGPRVRIRKVDLQIPDQVPNAVRQRIERNYRRERSIRRRGRFSDTSARNDLGDLLSAMAERGYLCARAQMRVALWPEGFDQPGANAVIDPTSALEVPGQPHWLERQLESTGLDTLRAQRRAGLYVRIEVDPGPRVMTSGSEEVNHLEIPIPASREVEGLPEVADGAWGAPRMLRDGPLRREGDDRAGGTPLTLTLDRDVERSITSRYQMSGYPLADAEMRWVYVDPAGQTHRVAQADRLTSPEVGLCRDHARDEVVTVGTAVSVYEGRRGEFGTTLVRGNFKTRPYVLRRELTWKSGEPYNRAELESTRRHIDGTGVVESVQIQERPMNCELSDDPDEPCVVHEVVSITESKDRFMDLAWGFGGATLDPLYGFIRPTFPNMWGTAWDLQLDAHVGANAPALRTALCSDEDCYERSGRFSLVRRRIFASPLTFELTAQIQRRVTPARGRIDSALGQVRLTWPVNEHWQLHFGYLVQAANISKGLVKPTLGSPVGCGSDGGASCRPPNRAEAIVPDLTGALQTGVTYQRVDNAFNPEDGFIASTDFLLASPYFGGRDWWLRYELVWQHFIPLPRTNARLSFRYQLSYGHAIPLPGLPGANTTSIPEVWRYFGGGTPDLGLRGIEPQTMLVDIETIEQPFGVLTLRPVAQGGHIRALGTAALQVVTVRNLLGGKLAHSLFLDLGILTQRWRHVDFGRDLRRSVGVNFIKWNIRIVTLALGYAVLIPNSIFPGNVRPTDDKNGRFVFDVGATF
jgi:outer membrane protein assembly factor BamA